GYLTPSLFTISLDCSLAQPQKRDRAKLKRTIGSAERINRTDLSYIQDMYRYRVRKRASLQTPHILDTNGLDFYLQVRALQTAICKNQAPQRQFLSPGCLSVEHNEPFTVRVVSSSAVKQNKHICTTKIYLF
ncbi:hypothetical protein ATANTOWER_007704, partial [Ataeniobius toweri]|nr:hypothetical protein [Ataeniobius toweri]